MDVLGEGIDEPPILVIIKVVWCHSSQDRILLLVVRNCAIACSVQAVCNGFADIFAFEVGALQITEEFLAGGLACEKQIANVRTEVLVRLQTGGGRPVGVGSVCPSDVSDVLGVSVMCCRNLPRGLCPPLVPKVSRVRDICAVHASQDFHYFGLCFFKGLRLYSVGLVVYDRRNHET